MNPLFTAQTELQPRKLHATTSRWDCKYSASYFVIEGLCLEQLPSSALDENVTSKITVCAFHLYFCLFGSPVARLVVVPNVPNMFLPLLQLHQSNAIHFSPQYQHSGYAEQMAVVWQAGTPRHLASESNRAPPVCLNLLQANTCISPVYASVFYQSRLFAFMSACLSLLRCVCNRCQRSRISEILKLHGSMSMQTFVSQCALSGVQVLITHSINFYPKKHFLCLSATILIFLLFTTVQITFFFVLLL